MICIWKLNVIDIAHYWHNMLTTHGVAMLRLREVKIIEFFHPTDALDVKGLWHVLVYSNTVGIYR